MPNLVATGTNSPNVNGTYSPNGVTGTGEAKYTSTSYDLWVEGSFYYIGVYATATKYFFKFAGSYLVGTYGAFGGGATGTVEVAWVSADGGGAVLPPSGPTPPIQPLTPGGTTANNIIEDKISGTGVTYDDYTAY
jgi:hypothetical protein